MKKEDSAKVLEDINKIARMAYGATVFHSRAQLVELRTALTVIETTAAQAIKTLNSRKKPGEKPDSVESKCENKSENVRQNKRKSGERV